MCRWICWYQIIWLAQCNFTQENETIISWLRCLTVLGSFIEEICEIDAFAEQKSCMRYIIWCNFETLFQNTLIVLHSRSMPQKLFILKFLRVEVWMLLGIGHFKNAIKLLHPTLFSVSDILFDQLILLTVFLHFFNVTSEIPWQGGEVFLHHVDGLFLLYETKLIHVEINERVTVD